MDVEDYIVLFLAVWVLLSALATKSTGVFMTLTLIGLLITVEVSGLFMNREQKENLKPLIEVLVVVFTLIVIQKVYEVLSGG
ncbi:hypothetical protein [Thermococcus sp.]